MEMIALLLILSSHGVTIHGYNQSNGTQQGNCAIEHRFAQELEGCRWDEMDSSSFMCIRDSGGYCVNASSVCDGFIDCPLGDDERLERCPDVELSPCPDNTIRCGNTKVCRANDTSCTGIATCPGGYDRRTNCGGSYPTPQCLPGQFACDGVCKPRYMLCNYLADCFDGVDEDNNYCQKRKPEYQLMDPTISDSCDADECIVPHQ